MAFSFGGLINAGVMGAAGALKGANAREQRDYERQQAEQNRKDRLQQEALMMYLKMNPSPKPPEPMSVADGSTLVDPITGRVIYQNPREATDRVPSRQLKLNANGEYVSVDPQTGLDLQGQPVRAPQPPPGYTVVQTDQGFTYVPTRPTVQGTGTMPVPAPGGGQLQPKAPESANAAVRNNEALIAEIDQAIEALRKEPGATGLVKGLARSVPVIGPQIMAGLDPAGDAARAALSRVSAGQIHDLYGGNLTKNEVGRSDWAPDPKYGVSANITRLEQGKRKLQAINATIQSQYPQVRGVSDASPQSLTPADLERAKADPGFADWLRKKGYTVP